MWQRLTGSIYWWIQMVKVQNLFFILLCVCVCVSAIQCSGSECIWEAEQSRRIRHGYGRELRYCIHMEIKKSISVKPCHSRRASCEIPGLEHTLNSFPKFLLFSLPFSVMNIINSCLLSLHCGLIWFFCSLASLNSAYVLSLTLSYLSHSITPFLSLHPFVSRPCLPIFFPRREGDAWQSHNLWPIPFSTAALWRTQRRLFALCCIHCHKVHHEYIDVFEKYRATYCNTILKWKKGKEGFVVFSPQCHFKIMLIRA